MDETHPFATPDSFTPDPFAGADEPLDPQDEDKLAAARDRLLEAARVARAAKQAATEAKKAREAAEQELIELMVNGGHTSLKREDGAMVVMTTTVRFSCLAADRAALLDWAPPELRTVNAGTLSGYCKQLVADGGELPEIIRKFEKAGLQVRGLKG